MQRALAFLLTWTLPALACAAPYTLTWTLPTQNVDGSALTDLAGTRVYERCGAGAYAPIADKPVPATTHAGTKADNGQQCWFRVTAYDTSGNESVYSNEVTKSFPATAAPVVNFAANPTSILSGGSTVLTWSSSGATGGCIGSGAWSGSKPLAGSQTFNGIASARTWTLTCTNAAGSTARSASVTIQAPAVNPPMPPVINSITWQVNTGADVSDFGFIQARSGDLVTSLAYTSNVTAGSLLVGIFRSGGTVGGKITGVSDNVNGAWTLAEREEYYLAGTPPNPEVTGELWYFINSGGGAITVTPAVPSGNVRLGIAEYSAPAGTTLVESNEGFSTTDVTTFTSNALATLSGDNLVIGAITTLTLESTHDSPWVERAVVTNRLRLADQISLTSGTPAYTGTIASVGDEHEAIIAAFKGSGVVNDMSAAGSISITGVADLDALGALVAAGLLSITGFADLSSGAAPPAPSLFSTASPLRF